MSRPDLRYNPEEEEVMCKKCREDFIITEGPVCPHCGHDHMDETNER